MYILTGNFIAYEYDGYDPGRGTSPVKRQLFHVFDNEEALKEYILAESYTLATPYQKFSELSNVKIYKLAGEVSYQKTLAVSLTQVS